MSTAAATDNPFALTDEQRQLKMAVGELCKKYPAEYWRELDAKREYPDAFVNELTHSGFLGVLIPEEYGGGGLGITEGAIVLEEINRSGGNAGACHAQMYIMGTVLRHGSEEQKKAYLPKIATGELRLQAFGVTEPNAGSDTTKLQTTAVRQGDRYVVNGQKMFISRVLQSDLMLLLARTTPVDKVKQRTQGLSVFLIDIRPLKGHGLEVRPLRMMMNHSTNALFFDNMEIPASSLIGEEGKGFAYILDGMNAERILVASDSLGDGRWFIEKAVAYSQQRVVFGKPIGANQGVQFPIAKAHMALEAADLMRTKAAKLFDAGQPCGPEANMAKYLAAEAAWDAANACIDCHGGYGYAEEYDIERKFREARLYKTAPINNNLVMAYVGQHVLGMPRSY
jgi:acyl-CoA dehydrogenase